jgi:hypothetical protein
VPTRAVEDRPAVDVGGMPGAAMVFSP